MTKFAKSGHTEKRCYGSRGVATCISFPHVGNVPNQLGNTKPSQV